MLPHQLLALSPRNGVLACCGPWLTGISPEWCGACAADGVTSLEAQVCHSGRSEWTWDEEDGPDASTVTQGDSTRAA